MAIVLKLKKGETVERGLKRMKKVLDREGLIKKLRDDRYFEKPCVKARKKSQRARIRNRSRRGRMELNRASAQVRKRRLRHFAVALFFGKIGVMNRREFLTGAVSHLIEERTR